MGVLAVDIGNSHTVLGLVSDGVVGPTWRVATDLRATADQWAVLLRGLLGRDQAVQVEGFAVCAAVPSVLAQWRDVLAAGVPGLPVVPHLVVEPGVRTGLRLMVDNPREVGSDRIMNAVAASARFSGPLVVVGFSGTATTFDVVDAEGRYVGGAICPGIEISWGALGREGAQLRQVELARPRSVIARNTVEALQSGMLFGVASQVEGMVERMRTELGAPASIRVIATGYLADLVLDECDCFTDHVPWLALLGLELVFARNR